MRENILVAAATLSILFVGSMAWSWYFTEMVIRKILSVKEFILRLTCAILVAIGTFIFVYLSPNDAIGRLRLVIMIIIYVAFVWRDIRR